MVDVDIVCYLDVVDIEDKLVMSLIGIKEKEFMVNVEYVDGSIENVIFKVMWILSDEDIVYVFVGKFMVYKLGQVIIIVVYGGKMVKIIVSVDVLDKYEM